jgi:putative thioredoxin
MEGLLTGAIAPKETDVIADSDQKRFAVDVIEASRTVPVIVDFWAPWCGPCKQLTPTIEKVVKGARGAVKLVKINIDENQALAQQLRIQSIPTVYAFFAGRPIDGFQGALPESQVKAFVDKLVQAARSAGAQAPADPLVEYLEHAKQAIEEGDLETATQIYTELLHQAPDMPELIAGLARCQFQGGDAAAARKTLDAAPKTAATHQDIVALRSQIDLAEQAQKAGPTAELEARIAADPKDHQARIDLAIAQFAAGERAAALDHLLTSIKLERTWNEGAARLQLLKFFEALGFADPLSVDGRKRLSSILFS